MRLRWLIRGKTLHCYHLVTIKAAVCVQFFAAPGTPAVIAWRPSWPGLTLSAGDQKRHGWPDLVSGAERDRQRGPASSGLDRDCPSTNRLAPRLLPYTAHRWRNRIG